MTQPAPPLRQCMGKQAFHSRDAAETVIREKKRRAKHGHHIKDRLRGLATLNPYRCRECHEWHIGGSYYPKPPFKKRKRT